MPSHRFTAEECKQTGIWAMTPEERRQHSPAGETSQAKIRRPEITEKYLIDLVICPPVSIHAIGRRKSGHQSIPTWSIKKWLYSTVILIGGQMTGSMRHSKSWSVPPEKQADSFDVQLVRCVFSSSFREDRSKIAKIFCFCSHKGDINRNMLDFFRSSNV